MHMWQVSPEAHEHLVEVIHDALALSHDGRGAKIEQAGGIPGIPDGTLSVTADTAIASAMGAANRHDGVTLLILDRVVPTTVDPHHLAELLQVSLRWRSFVVITADDDPDEGRSWFIQHPKPYNEDQSGDEPVGDQA